MRWVVSVLSVCVIGAAAAIAAGCGDDGSKTQNASGSQQSVEAYFKQVADIGAAYQSSRRGTTDPLDTLSPDIPPLIDEAANALVRIDAPAEVSSLHGEYAKSVKAFATAATALAQHHDEVGALRAGATPSAALSRLLGEYETADTRVRDNCIPLQEVANARKIDVDIGCRAATVEFKCYNTNASGSSNVASFDEARKAVVQYAGANAPIPTKLPAWVKDFQVATYTKPTEQGDPDSAGIVFANYDDRTRPQVTLSFIPRPFCGRENPPFQTHATIGTMDVSIRGLRSGEAITGVVTTLKLSDRVVRVEATWWSDDAPASYEAMVPTIMEWAQLVLDTANGR